MPYSPSLPVFDGRGGAGTGTDGDLPDLWTTAGRPVRAGRDGW